ncbi:MAG: hypothetical protein F6K00_19550 [Leptolyngbya sp. SIOISBB]|nr:hypothetical protein [Leptolyngbya sp. SIOISBB]
MTKKPDKRQQAYTMWVQGTPITKIAARLKVHRTTVQVWKKASKWDELKDSIPEPPQEPRRPKLLSFEGGKSSRDDNSQPIFDVGDLSTIEGQTALIDRLISFAMGQVQRPEGPQTYASSMNAVPKLLAERRAIAPLDRTALLLLLMDKYRDPADLLEDLKAQGWGRKAS